MASTVICKSAIFVIIASLQLSAVFGIYCFQCNSLHDPECFNLQANDTSSIFYRPCEKTPESGDRELFCRKIVQIIHDRDDMVRVIRRCGWILHEKRDCYHVANKGHEEVSCQCFEHGCNAAHHTFPATYILSVGLFLPVLSLFRSH